SDRQLLRSGRPLTPRRSPLLPDYPPLGTEVGALGPLPGADGGAVGPRAPRRGAPVVPAGGDSARRHSDALLLHPRSRGQRPLLPFAGAAPGAGPAVLRPAVPGAIGRSGEPLEYRRESSALPARGPRGSAGGPLLPGRLLVRGTDRL